MSAKKSYSSIELSPLDSPEISEPLRKRWKSEKQENPNFINSVPNGDVASAMAAAVEDVIKPVDVPILKNDHVDNICGDPTIGQKQIRYDRQLRLWGDHGQALLEKAHVCLLNATATGTEILKSLILPGVGSFTIVDGSEVSGADVGSNFFLENTSIGQSRAKVSCELLQELNSDVRGNYETMSPEKYISQKGFAAFDQYTVVIGTGLNRKLASSLGAYLFGRAIPFIVCQSVGLVGYVRLLVKEHAIIESHPDNPLPNFMLDQPFAELVQLIGSMNLDVMDHKDHSHTPYLILLFKALDIWRGQKGDSNAFPRTHKEKKEIKEVLLSMRRPDEKGRLDEENFQEAVNAVNTAFIETSVPQNVRNILISESANTLTASSSNFWLLCHALRRFVDEYGRLPARGTLPDMVSDSDRYMRLQNVFLRKAEEDASTVHSYALEASKLLNRDIPISETRLFCKNASTICLIRSGRTSADDDVFGIGSEPFIAELKNGENLNALWYLILGECEAFYDVHGRYPGSVFGFGNANEAFEKDKNDVIGRVENQINKLLGDEEKPAKVKEAVEEICRYGGSQLHTVASFLGGVAAQEVIKLITYQYVPVNNTYVFDGNTGQGTVLHL